MADINEAAVKIDAQGTLLDGRFGQLAADRAVVITHPHPQYGGNMDNPVVATIASAYQAKDWSTLRLNFRGTGSSQGSYDHGDGEQLDIDAAIAYLAQSGARTIELAGYSFGAWVISRWAQRRIGHNHSIRLVAPPVALMDYQDIQRITGLKQIIVGSRDEIAPAAQVQEQMQTWEPASDLRCIEDADHFFWNHLEELHSALVLAIPGQAPQIQS